MAIVSTAFSTRNATKLLRDLMGRVRFARPDSLKVTALSSYQDYLQHCALNQQLLKTRAEAEMSLLKDSEPFTVTGYCYPCRRPQEFAVDYQYGSEASGRRTPNWRESLICACGLNNRLRASIQLFDLFCNPHLTDRIYITEQTTPMYRWLESHYNNIFGSEYLGEQIPFGQMTPQGVRNESLTRLTFSDSYFDHIISFDVLEHIPDPEKALRECHRCLKPGGCLLLSVPFVVSAEQTLVRARLSAAGDIEHLHAPEFHGDPLSNAGCLCFYHFGWDLLDTLRQVGFSQAKVLLYWSKELGYLGGEQLQILATR